MLTALNITAQVLLVISSLLLVLSILLHKGQGGGMSDMFGGGLTSAMSASGVGQRNLNIATVVTSIVWLFAVILFNFTMETPAKDEATAPAGTSSSAPAAPGSSTPVEIPSESPDSKPVQ